MKIEVTYESIPYTIKGALVDFHRNERTLCSQVLEVVEYKDIYKAIEQEGFSNSIMYTRILKEDGTFDELATKREVSKAINKYINDKGLSELVTKIKKDLNKTNNKELNLVIKSWNKN